MAGKRSREERVARVSPPPPFTPPYPEGDCAIRQNYAIAMGIIISLHRRGWLDLSPSLRVIAHYNSSSTSSMFARASFLCKLLFVLVFLVVSLGRYSQDASCFFIGQVTTDAFGKGAKADGRQGT